MKEFEYTFDKGLKGGLRRFKETMAGDQTLVECHNLMPTEQGLRIHHFINLFTASTDQYILQEIEDKLLTEAGDGILF